jgi:ribosome-associated translation inhibitor RaiA
MKIQFNTDKNINGITDFITPLTILIEEDLEKYSSQITRIEVHLSDEDGDKDGLKAKRCLLEARLSGMNPIAVSSQSDTEEQAVSEALNKLRSSLETILGRISNHKGNGFKF